MSKTTAETPSGARTSRSALVDTHCHIDLFPDPEAVLRRCDAMNVYTIAVTTTPSVFLALEDRLIKSRYVRAALGMHPELAHERESELPLFHRLLARTRYVGEVGLDYQTADLANKKVQRRVFESIVRSCDATGGKVLTIHSRRAANDVVDIVGSDFRGSWILHWYSGSRTTLARALASGAYISVNTAMLNSERGCALIRDIPPDRVLTETDGPFVSANGRPAEPADVGLAITQLAKMWATSAEESQACVYENFGILLREPSVGAVGQQLG